jgi:MFS transporter, FHS family, glucose/mannose:H+ symporter
VRLLDFNCFVFSAYLKSMRSRIHWLSISLAYSSLFILGLADNIRGPLFPDVMVGLRLTDMQGSWLWALASFFGFLGSVVTNRLIRAQGVMRSFQISLGLMAAGQFGMALSRDLWTALGSCVLFGLSIGILGVAQNLMVFRAGPMEVMSRLQAGLHSNYALSSLMAPLLLTVIYWFFPNWRAGYVGGGLLTTLGFVAFCFVSRSEVDQVHSRVVPRPDGHHSRGLKRKAIYVGLIASGYVLTELMVSSRLALFLRREAGYDFLSASLATTGFFVLMLLGRLLLILWRPRISNKIQIMICLVSTLTFLLLGLFAQPWLLILTGLAMAPIFPLVMSYIGEKFPHDLNFVAAWAVALFGFFVVFMHVFVGLMSDSIGITKALFVGPVAILVSIVLLAWDRRVLE